jgi:hypothetical protein
MSGELLRTAVYANPNSSYFALAGSGGGVIGSTINTTFINASTINTSTITSRVMNGQTINTQDFNVSTIVVNQTAEYGLSIFSPTGTAANAQIVGDSSASLSLSGGNTSLTLAGEGSVYITTGSAGVLQNNNIQLEQRDTEANGKTTGVYTVANNEYSAYIELRHDEEIGDEVYTTVVGSVRVGGDLLPSTMNIALKDADGNALATVGFSSNGITSDSITTVAGANLLTQQLGGVNTQYRTKMFNNATVDLGQLMPMASVRNTTGGLEYASGSKIAQFGMMSTGSIYMPIPATTYASACNVVLAPYTVFELYTSPIGSGGSTVYNNSGNAYFSTFTAEAYLNGNAFNSYKMFFGN